MKQVHWWMLLLSTLSLLCIPRAGAIDYAFDNGLSVAVDTTITYGLQWRTERRHTDLDGDEFLERLQLEPLLPLLDPEYSRYQTELINGNDGNQNFDKGLISQRLTALFDVDFNLDSLGFFLRGKAFYDEFYRADETSLDGGGARTYNSGVLYGGRTASGRFPARTRAQHGSNIQFLDAYAYGTWELSGDRLLDLRLGRQVINWGESTFYQGVNSIQNRVDATAANTPGVEIKEIFLPTGALYLQVDLTPSLALETYYQYEWLENELNGVGSYFSTTDQVGPGAHAFLIPTPNNSLVPADIRGNQYQLRGVLRQADEKAKDSGQWGVALHYLTANAWDIGLYHVRGHDKKPSFVLDYIAVEGSPLPVPLDYRLQYFEDIRATAVSFTTVLGDTNVQGELSWLQDTPMVDQNGDPALHNFGKAQLGALHVFGPTFLADDTLLTLEGFYARVSGADSAELNADKSGWGYSLLVELAFNNVFQGWDMVVPIYFKHDVAGSLAEIQHQEGSRVLSTGIRATYLNNLTANISYSWYQGGGRRNLLQDRDNVAVTLKYSF